MLEQQLEKTNELLAAILDQLSNGGTPAATEKPAATTSRTKPKPAAAPKDAEGDEAPDGVARSQMNAAVQEYSTKFGKDKAKALIKSVGKADKMASIDPEHFKAMFDACQAGVEDGEGEPTEQEHSRAEMEAKLKEVQGAFDSATAKAIVKTSGVVKMAEIPEDKIDFVFNACVEKLAEAGSEEDDDI